MQTDRQRQRGEAGRAQLEEAGSRLEGLSVMMRGWQGGWGRSGTSRGQSFKGGSKALSPPHTHSRL